MVKCGRLGSKQFIDRIFGVNRLESAVKKTITRNTVMQRGEFSSRLAFIFAASGSAVGLGNIWGFPTNAAQNGGAVFVLMYLILAFLLAYPGRPAKTPE